MMFGVAQNFKDSRCQGGNVKISKSMQPKVEELTKLVKETYAKIPAEGISTEKVLKQMEIFQTIKLPNGRTIQDCFTEKITQGSPKQENLKSHILQLAKNLAKHNKTTIKDHPSRKTNSGTSRSGFGIS